MNYSSWKHNSESRKYEDAFESGTIFVSPQVAYCQSDTHASSSIDETRAIPTRRCCEQKYCRVRRLGGGDVPWTARDDAFATWESLQ